MTGFSIRPTEPGDRGWIDRLIAERWAATFVVAHGHAYRCSTLAGFVASAGDERLGLATYNTAEKECELVSLDSLLPGQGIGTMLLEAVRAQAIGSGCRRLWLTTTNDNLKALRFYQKRGFALARVHRHTVELARKLKPIPALSAEGIPIRDELELEMVLPVIDGVRHQLTYWRATSKDCALLAQLNHQLIQDEGHRNRMTVPELETRMREWLDAQYVGVLFAEKGQVVAYAVFLDEPTEVYLRQFFVVRDRRRCGIGRDAMRILLQEVWPRSKRLTVEVLTANQAAVAFWHAVGYGDYSLKLEIMPQ
jgi:GNAT superfamily N-acetyltransferase